MVVGAGFNAEGGVLVTGTVGAVGVAGGVIALAGPSGESAGGATWAAARPAPTSKAAMAPRRLDFMNVPR